MFSRLSRPISRATASIASVNQLTVYTKSRKSFGLTPSSAMAEGKYPAKKHAQKVVDHISKRSPSPNGVLYLEAKHTKLLEDNDEPEPFRQRRYFYYLTGCNEPDCYFAYDIAAQKSTLFIPPIDSDSVIWSGLPLSPEEALKKYDVDDVKYTNEVNPYLAHVGASYSKAGKQTSVYAIADQVSEQTTFIGFDQKDFQTLKPSIDACRVSKDEFEVGLIRKANEISTEAHHAAFKKAKTASNECEVEAVFLQKCIAQNAKEQSYHGIFASGRAAATLHYVKNDQPIQGKLNMLIDAGAEWECYCSDITRTFPINGVFSPESRAIYDIVLKMQLECIGILKAGIVWDDVHALAHRIAIDGLHTLGILKGDKEEMFKKRVSVAFFPHGLGHHLGMDTHDVGGNPNYEDKDSMFRYLRLRGEVPEGSVVTVEPGIYFCNFIIEPYLEDAELSKYIDKDVLDKYWDVGGARIEDNIYVTKDGHVNLTTTAKEAEEVENMILTA
ncbi:metallopeptidase family M24 [Zalerion maritima]|uniref:Xaa-Pro aminopeptidase n=1 Tax=Zalerion maritima TaxID=339359 RepID=A0AAD5RKJ7_9PEZI|nr:metallopeptidase family M24 [Zalerion maritima]